MKLMKFLLGLAIGAGVALLVAPKSGRELRQQLAGGASGKLLGAAPDEYPQPEPVAEWRGTATVVAEPPVVDEAPWAATEPAVQEDIVEEVVVEEAVVEEVVVEEAVVEEAPRPFPVWDEPAVTPAGEACARASTRRVRRWRTSWPNRSRMRRLSAPTTPRPPPMTPSSMQPRPSSWPKRPWSKPSPPSS